MNKLEKIVTLTRPLKRGDTQIETVKLREPSTGELRGLDSMDVLRMGVDAHKKLVPRISNITENEFNLLSPKDLVLIQNEVVTFFVE